MTPTPMNPPNPNEAAPGMALARSEIDSALSYLPQEYVIQHDDPFAAMALTFAKLNHVIAQLKAFAPLPPTGEGAKSKERNGVWIDQWGACKVCDGEIPHGHTENCDIFKLEQQVRSTDPALRAAEEALGAARGFIAGVSFCNDEGERKEIWDAVRAALELIRAARKEGV